MKDLVPKEILEELAKVAADAAVNAQTPARKVENESTAARIIKFVLTLTIFEMGVAALYISDSHSKIWDRLSCQGSRTTSLEYEHIRDSDYKPKSCRK